MKTHSTFQRLVLPGLIFQSAMVGGGYATGRELVEFFLVLGPVNSLVAMIVATLTISVVTSVAFEFARSFSLYDYKSFFEKLLGSGWFVFEIAYMALILLVLSVLGAAAGEMVHSNFDVAEYWGILLLMGSVAVFVFLGSSTIEKFLTYWSLLLYGAYALLIIWTISAFGNEIGLNISSDETPIKTFTVFKQGWTYAGYNLVIVTAVLFAVRHMSTRQDAVISGILCGPLSMIPAFLLLFSMIPHYPAIVDEVLPITYLLERLNSAWFNVFLQLVIFGTFIETGTALLHSINERVSESYLERKKSMPQLMRPVISTIALFVAIYLATRFGVIDLIGSGYAYSTYLFLAILVVPLLTRGLYLIATGPTRS
jgi:uncharacterized membrane protein YkvI